MTTWNAADPRLNPMLTVARWLDELRDRVLFLGGAVVPLLITDPGAASARPTKDIDVIIEITTTVAYHKLGERLRALGFSEDASDNAPLCRWIINGFTVDIMPTDEKVLGYTNPWFRTAMSNAMPFSFTDGQTLNVISPAYFCATKLEAFADRGKGDYIMSHDMEDILAVIDGRDELLRELTVAEPTVRAYIASSLRTFLASPDFIDALPGHLPGDAASQDRLPLLQERLERLARLS
jgi:hypothetical protein